MENAATYGLGLTLFCPRPAPPMEAMTSSLYTRGYVEGIVGLCGSEQDVNVESRRIGDGVVEWSELRIKSRRTMARASRSGALSIRRTV